MLINGKTQIFGVLGRNINFTLSPAINNFAARQLGLNCAYIPLQLDDPDTLADLLRFLPSSNVMGLNVTTPYKQSTARLLRSTVPSVNLLYRDQDNHLCATSNDGAGFWQALQHIDSQREKLRTVIILGNGGVCAALLHFFCQQRLPLQKITVLRRNPQRDVVLQQINYNRYQLTFVDFNPTQLQHAIADASEQQLLVQASAAPQQGDDLQRFCAPLENFHGVLVDLIYEQPSALYHAAQIRGLRCQDGLPMLIEQARLGQQQWWGKSASYAAIVEHLRKNKYLT